MVIINLSSMRNGQTGKVTGVGGGFGLRRRLEALGIRVGVNITKVSGATRRGPVVVRAGNTTVAVGHGMARRIRVEVV